MPFDYSTATTPDTQFPDVASVDKLPQQGQITLNPDNQTVPQDVISLGQSSLGNTTPDIATWVAKNTSIGIRQPYQDIYDKIMSGMEAQYREEIAKTDNLGRTQQAQDTLTQKVITNSVSDEDYKTYMSAITPADPATVFEVAHGNAVVGQLDTTAANKDTFLPKSYQEIPVELSSWKAIGGNAVAIRDFSLRLAAELEAEKQGSSYVKRAGDFIKTLSQVYEQYQIRANSGMPFFQDFGEGSYLDDLRLRISRMPAAEGQKELTDIVGKLKNGWAGGNLDTAQKVALAVAGTSVSDRQLDDLMTYVTVATSLTATKTLGLAGKIFSKGERESIEALREYTKKAIKDQVKAVDLNPPSKAAIEAASGDYGKAAATKVDEELAAKKFAGKPDTLQDAVDPLTSNFNLIEARAGENPGRGNQNLVNQLILGTRSLKYTLMDKFSTMLKVDRTPELKELTDGDKLKIADEIRANTPGHFISDVSDPYFHSPFINSPSVDIKIVNQTGDLFPTRGAAEAYAEHRGLKIPENNIETDQNGLGWYLRVRKPLDTSASSIWRDFYARTKDPAGWTWARAALNWLVTPEETMSVAARQNRMVASVAPSILMEVAAPQFRALKSLRRGAITIDPLTGRATSRNYSYSNASRRWQDFMQVLKVAQKAPDKEGKPGMFFENTSELQDYYQNHFHRLPDDAEVQGYWAFKNLVEMDRVLRDLRVVTNMWSRGAQFHTVSWLNAERSLTSSPEFAGIQRKAMPGGNARVLILKNNGQYELVSTGDLKTKNVSSKIGKDLSTGQKQIVELYNAEERPFANLVGHDERVTHVVTDRLDTRDIPYTVLPRRGGGHWDVEHEFYIKQAKITREQIGNAVRSWYEGDTTIMPISIRTLGKEVATHLDNIRELLRLNDAAGAKRYMDENPIMGLTFKEVNSWFDHSKHPETGELLPPRLSKTEKIEVVPNNTLLVDHNNELRNRYDGKSPSFRDGTKESNPARQAQVAYTGQRDSYDLYTVNNWGTKHNPLYSYEPGALVDPVEAMNRGLMRIINTTFLDDYKDFAVNRWVAQASNILRADPRELAAIPYYHFHNPNWLDPKNNALEISRLQATNWQIKQFLGIRSKLANGIDAVISQFVDKMYEKAGPKYAHWVPQEFLGKITDPTKFLRAMAYHLNLGFYAPYQVIVQAQTWGLIAALAPRSVVAGTAATFMHQWARFNPGAVDHMDKLLSSFKIPGLKNWKPGEFKEAYEVLNRTGFGNIQADQLQLSGAAMSQRLIAPISHDILDGMTFFFKEGERSVRYGAWYTAFKEFRHERPTGRITQDDMRQILSRANDLHANMTKASASAMQSGVLATTTQFLSYQARMAELVLGNRPGLGWNTKEGLLSKARIVATMSALYGVPMGSIGVMGLPLADYFRKVAQDNNYVVGDSFAQSVFMEGIPSVVTSWLTSPDGDISKGNWYNFGGRYGYQGLMQDILRPDETFWKVLMGAAGSKTADIISDLDPFWKSMVYNDQLFPRVWSDYLDVFKEINSVNKAWQGINAISAGILYSKKGAPLIDGISAKSALFMFGSGLQPQAVPDAFLRNWTLKDFNARRDQAEKMFQQNFNRGLMAYRDHSDEQGKAYMTRAFAYIDILNAPLSDYGKAIARSTSTHGTMVKDINWSAMNNKIIPPDQYGKIERIQESQKAK